MTKRAKRAKKSTDIPFLKTRKKEESLFSFVRMHIEGHLDSIWIPGGASYDEALESISKSAKEMPISYLTQFSGDAAAAEAFDKVARNWANPTQFSGDAFEKAALDWANQTQSSGDAVTADAFDKAALRNQ